MQTSPRTRWADEIDIVLVAGFVKGITVDHPQPGNTEPSPQFVILPP
jgi:hypothetical protein